MSTITRYPPPLPMPFSKAVRAGGFIFVSGQLPMDGQGQIIGEGVAEQTRIVLERIAATLADCGASLADVVKVTTWLCDMDDFPAYNDEYRRHFTEGFPARSTVGAALYRGARVEMEVQAWVGG